MCDHKHKLIGIAHKTIQSGYARTNWVNVPCTMCLSCHEIKPYTVCVGGPNHRWVRYADLFTYVRLATAFEVSLDPSPHIIEVTNTWV